MMMKTLVICVVNTLISVCTIRHFAFRSLYVPMACVRIMEHLYPAFGVQSTFTCQPSVGQLGPSGNFLCNQSLGILKAFNPGDVFQAVSLQLLWLGLEKGVGWQM